MEKNTFNILIEQISKFVLLVPVSMGLTILITALLHEKFIVPVRISYAIGLLSAILANFYFCRKIIFESNKKMLGQLIVFITSSFFFRGIEYGSFLLQEKIVGLPYMVAIIFIHTISFWAKFMFYRTFVF